MLKPNFKLFVLIAVIFTAFISSANAAQEDVQFPFELKKIDGATLLAKNYKKIDDIRVRGLKEKAIGQITRLYYRIPAGVTIPSEIVSTYQSNFIAEGFQVVAKPEVLKYSSDEEGARAYFLCGEQANSYCGAFESWGLDHFKERENDVNSVTLKKSLPTGDAIIVVTASKIIRDGTNWHTTPNAGAVVKSMKFNNGDSTLAIAIVLPKITSTTLIKEDLNFLKASLEKDGFVNLYGILFDFNKTDIKQESAQVISEIAKLLQSDPALTLAIVGHTDNVGTDAYNQKLSEGRAKAVVDTLVQAHGIAANRLAGYGQGASKPVASNDTDEGRAKNRRVELISNKK